MPDPRPEEQAVADATRAVQALYERHGRMQEGAAVVAGLLALQGGVGAGESQGSLGSQPLSQGVSSSQGRRGT